MIWVDSRFGIFNHKHQLQQSYTARYNYSSFPHNILFSLELKTVVSLIFCSVSVISIYSILEGHSCEQLCCCCFSSVGSVMDALLFFLVLKTISYRNFRALLIWRCSQCLLRVMEPFALSETCWLATWLLLHRLLLLSKWWSWVRSWRAMTDSPVLLLLLLVVLCRPCEELHCILPCRLSNFGRSVIAHPSLDQTLGCCSSLP